mmetsp:Transcript_17191/g.40307  ORF Transcript_17191/g.40307 Transcript_17191/m.40307 type:complete len:182 (+) Transcript_17191:1-546(+)
MAARLAGEATGVEVDWCALYIARCRKRALWAGEREAARAKKMGRAARLEAELGNDGEAIQKFAIGPEGRNKRTRCVREKTCRRCGAKFMPGASAGGECNFHPGKYQQVDEDGVVIDDGGRGAALQRQVQDKLRKSARKQQRGHLELATFGPKHTVVEISCRWSCCDNPILTSTGCSAGVHF